MKKVLIILLSLLLVGCGEETFVEDDQNFDFSFSDKQMDETYIDARNLVLASENILINEAGIYELSGELFGSVIVDTNEDVKLVLNNVNINSDNYACIYSKNLDNLIITLKENSVNNLNDGNEYASKDEDVDGAIYCDNNLIINGSGVLNITGNYKNGIVSKDDLTIVNSTINIKCLNKAIHGKDSVKIKNSNININSGSDGIKSNNEEKGFVYLDNSDIAIKTKTNGIKAYSLIQVESGELNISESKEGLEAKRIIINDGNIAILASDDGINSSLEDANKDEVKNNKQLKEYYEKIERLECFININGGNIYIDADGDGLDSNGSININGGNIVVEGPSSGKDCGLDYIVGCDSNDGSILVSSMSDEIQEFSNSSKQYGVTYVFGKTYKKGGHILIENDNGILFDYVISKQFNALQFSSEKMKKGEAIKISIDDDVYELK